MESVESNAEGLEDTVSTRLYELQGEALISQSISQTRCLWEQDPFPPGMLVGLRGARTQVSLAKQEYRMLLRVNGSLITRFSWI